MTRNMTLFLGPELYWFCLYLLLGLLINVTNAPVKYMDEWWIRLSFIVPLVLVPLSFGFYFFPIYYKHLTIFRLIFAAMVGGHFVLDKAISTHTEQNAGTGTAYLMGMIFCFAVSVFIALFIIFKHYFFR